MRSRRPFLEASHDLATAAALAHRQASAPSASCPRQSERPLRLSAPALKGKTRTRTQQQRRRRAKGQREGERARTKGRRGVGSEGGGRGVDEVGGTPQGRESQRRRRPQPAGRGQTAQTGSPEQASCSQGAWRNGSASDSRSEGWEFESLCPHFCLPARPHPPRPPAGISRPARFSLAVLLVLLGALRAFGPQGQLPQALWRDFGRTASGKIRPDWSHHFFEDFGPSGGVPGICGNFGRTLGFAGDWLRP